MWFLLSVLDGKHYLRFALGLLGGFLGPLGGVLEVPRELLGRSLEPLGLWRHRQIIEKTLLELLVRPNVLNTHIFDAF